MAIDASGLFTRNIRKRIFLSLLFALAADATAATEQWVPLTQIAAPTPTAGSRFGGAVAMTGNFIVIGEPYADVGGNTGAGRIYVYSRNGAQATFLDSFSGFFPQSDAHFGSSIAIHGDTFIVGEPDFNHSASVPDSGQVYFFRLSASDGHFHALFSLEFVDQGAQFGYSLAISATRALIGTPGADSDTGKVFPYTLNTTTGTWASETAIQPNTPTNGARFGASVALFESPLAGGPLLAAIGSPGYSTASVDQAGAVYVFQHGAVIWTQSQRLLELSPVAADGFGNAVAINVDRVFGSSIARNNPGGADTAGSVTTFTGSAGSFAREQELFAVNGSTNSHFGASLAFDADDSRLLVGAPLANQGSAVTDSGAAFVFLPGSTTASWTQQDRLSLGAAAIAGDHLADSVTLAGTYAAAGCPQRDVGATANAGIVEIFAKDTIFINGFE